MSWPMKQKNLFNLALIINLQEEDGEINYTVKILSNLSLFKIF